MARNGAAAAETPDRHRRGDRTRSLIKKSIAKLAMRKDIADISLSDICKTAKLTTGALYFHFKGKDEAVEEMIIDVIEEKYGLILEGYDGHDFERLIAFTLEQSTNFHRSRGRLGRALVTIINTRPGAYQAWLLARRPVIIRFVEAITRARAARNLPTESAPYLAHVILNSLEDLAMDVFQWKNPTLTPFADTLENWNRRQGALWAWAILSPIPV